MNSWRPSPLAIGFIGQVSSCFEEGIAACARLGHSSMLQKEKVGERAGDHQRADDAERSRRCPDFPKSEVRQLLWVPSQPLVAKQSPQHVVRALVTTVPMPLLTLPEELLAQVMMRVADIRYINRATRVCRQLRVATEAACELRIREDGGPLYVPAASYFSIRASHRVTPFTWRTRLFFSFSEAYEQAFKLYVLDAGLLIYGSPCYQDPSALRESKCIAHVLNGLDDDDDKENDGEEEEDGAEANPYTVKDHYGVYTNSSTVFHKGREFVHVHELTEGVDAQTVEMSSWSLQRSMERANELMRAIIDGEILNTPWYIPTGVWMALRIGSRPAQPVDGPLIVVKTDTRVQSSHYWAAEAPQTVIELRDGLDRATRATVLGRVKLGYTTQPIDDTAGPTVWRFSVFDAASTDSTLVQAAVSADGEKGHATSKALADAATAFGPAEANLLAARVMLWRGVEEFCNSHIDERMPYQWPLRVSPDLIGKHGPFLAWRGLKLKPLANANLMMIFGGGSAWPYMNLGEQDDWGRWNSDYEDEESDDDSSNDEGLDLRSRLANIDSDRTRAKMAKIEAKREARDAKAEAARVEAAKRLLTRSFDPDREDADSEYEPDDKYCDACGKLTRRYAEEDASESHDEDDVCECPTEDEDDGDVDEEEDDDDDDADEDVDEDEDVDDEGDDDEEELDLDDCD